MPEADTQVARVEMETRSKVLSICIMVELMRFVNGLEVQRQSGTRAENVSKRVGFGAWKAADLLNKMGSPEKLQI